MAKLRSVLGMAELAVNPIHTLATAIAAESPSASSGRVPARISGGVATR
jgi:hypothetical protein